MTEEWQARLAARGLVVAHSARLSGDGAAPVFAADLADRRRVKVRLLATVGDARRIWTLLQGDGRGVLAPPVARIGCAIITAYVPGESLLEYLRRTRGRDERRWVRATGRLLAHLHAGRAPGGRAETAASHRRFFRAAIRRLERRGRVRREIAAQLRGIAAGGPRRARRAVTHGDLHPSNLIVTAGARLCAIDEERLAVRPAAFDIARVVARWPLDAEMEEELLFAYRRSGGRAESYVRHRRFWIGVALAVSAHYRTFFGLPGAAESVARLRRFASSGGTRGADAGTLLKG